MKDFVSLKDFLVNFRMYFIPLTLVVLTCFLGWKLYLVSIFIIPPIIILIIYVQKYFKRFSAFPWTTFISYHSNDESLAKEIRKYLEAKGIIVHMYDSHSKWDYTFGSMVKAIKESMFIVYASPTATDSLTENIEKAPSKYVKIELKSAEILDKNVIAIPEQPFELYDDRINANKELHGYYENVSERLMEAVYDIYPEKYDDAKHEEDEERYMFTEEMGISTINLLERMQIDPTGIKLLFLLILNYVLFFLIVVGIFQPILYILFFGGL